MTMEHGMLLVLACAVAVVLRAKKRSTKQDLSVNQVLNPPVVREMRNQNQFDLYVDLGYYN